MDYKEKYEQAIKRAKAMIKVANNQEETYNSVITIFPELKEGEDERIRKALINGFNKLDKSAVWYNGITNGQILDWLEKQGEKTVIDNGSNSASVSGEDNSVTSKEVVSYPTTSTTFKPKFKVGDFIVNDYCMGRVVELTNDAYLLDTEQGIPFSYEHNVHLWTIQDAKDGDFLVCGKDKLPFIFKGLLDKFHPDCPVAYCGICKDGIFSISSGDGWWTDEEVFPATKEQCEQLEKAIVDAGYKWDAKEKQLKEADSYCQEQCEGYQETGKCFADGECKAKRDAEQKPTDEEMKELLRTEYEKGRADAIAEKSWSEEDEEMLKMVIKLCEQCGNEYAYYWLKSLKNRIHPQSRWKPSDEQMKALWNVYQGGEEQAELATLYNDLKKLREE